MKLQALLYALGKGLARTIFTTGLPAVSHIAKRPLTAMFNKNIKLNKSFRPRPTVVTVQRHEAKKAGLHWDFRFRHRRRLISFVFKKRPPAHWSQDGTPPTKKFTTNVIRSNDHKIKYENFEGEIPEGQYGAGLQTIEYQSPGIIWSKRPGALHIYTPYNESPWSGEWTFIKFPKTSPSGAEVWRAIRTPAFQSLWLPRPKYTDVPPDQIHEKINDPSATLIGEQKVDGANFIVVVNSPGLLKDDIDVSKYIQTEAPLLSKAEYIVRKVQARFFKVADKNHPDVPPYTVGPASEIPGSALLDPEKVIALQYAFKHYGNIDLKGKIPVTLSMISRRYSKDGHPIHREGNVRHMVFTFVEPDFVGKVFRAELWHPDGVTTLSGILNSNADKAAVTQQKIGLVRMMVFDYEGSTVDGRFFASPMPYTERRKFYTEFVRSLNEARYGKRSAPHPKSALIFTVPEVAIGNPDDIYKFYKHITDSYDFPLGEGIVVKLPDEPARAYEWIKMKKTMTFDLKIVDILPGTGKYSNAAGKVLVADATGNIVATVGSGFTDEERYNMMKHPEEYIGKVIEVKAQALNKEALRAPRMIRWRPDKTAEEVDIVPLPSHEELIKGYLRGQGLNEEEIERAYWAVKVSAGWRPGV